MPPTSAAVERLAERLRMKTPLIAVYDCPPSERFAPLVEATGANCCFVYYPRWLRGETLVVRKGGSDFLNPENGCPGAKRALGLEKEWPPFMANYLTDGVGAPMGEGMMASAELAQQFLDRAVPPPVSGDAVMIGPLRLEEWDSVRSVTFLVDLDRLSALMTLARYWSDDADLVAAPFSTGCGLLWRELVNQDRDRPVISCTDMTMRKYLPPEIVSLTVTPARFEKMLTFPDDCFLYKNWWNELMDHRQKEAGKERAP